MRRLIVNADDFGLTRGVNRAILEANTQGIVTSATLMANGLAFQEAVDLSRSATGLGVGCHVVLVDGSPVLDPERVPSLIDHKNSKKEFRVALSSFALRCLRGQAVSQEIEAETTAQIRKLQSAGVAVTHLDTHKHTHMFPQVLRPILRAAAACGIKAIRNPVEPIPLSRVVSQPGLWKRWAQVKTLNRLSSKFRRAVQEAGMFTPDGTLGIVITGTMRESFLKMILQQMPEGTWELVCHPGYNDEELAAVKTRLRSSRVQELELLQSSAVRQELEKQGIDLISYRDLA